ncbi:MAG TPA: S41 family peptidase [Pedobacter sp.]|jgi:hypothetical protein
MQKIIFVFFLTLTFLTTKAQTTGVKNDTLKQFLGDVFSTIQQNSVYKSSFDWPSLKTKVFKGIDTAQSYDDLIPSIKFIYRSINDRHGFLNLYGKRIAMNDKPTYAVRNVLQNQLKNGIPKIKTQILDKQYGYILIPSNNDFGENSSILSQEIQDSLCKLNPKNLKGIIIDLRLNSGGSMFPMLLGLNQIVGNGTIGSFVDIEGRPITKWIIKNSSFYLDTQQVAVVTNGCAFSRSLKIVVLTSRITKSAGEDLAIALRGKVNTLFIGEETGGFTTSTSVHYVNGQLLTVASAFIADRTGKVYRDKISPDINMVEGDNFQEPKNDVKVTAALNWMKKHRSK